MYRGQDNSMVQCSVNVVKVGAGKVVKGVPAWGHLANANGDWPQGKRRIEFLPSGLRRSPDRRILSLISLPALVHNSSGYSRARPEARYVGSPVGWN